MEIPGREEGLPAGQGESQPKRRKCSTPSSESSSGEEDSEKQDYFPASRLFEYQWPLGEESAEHYMLQEQVAEYLDIRGIQRKYPELQRRSLELEERKYLLGRGAVTETQSNMGLVAVCSDEVMELMAGEFPRKYDEYMDVVQEREFQAALKRKIQETKRVAQMHAVDERKDSQSLLSEALKRTAYYNTQLSEQRRALRSKYFDTQTKILQVPRQQPTSEDTSRLPPQPSRYPVALLPGQYCDYYRKYSAEELRYLPVNTALELPPKVSTPPPKENEQTAPQLQLGNAAPTGTNMAYLLTQRNQLPGGASVSTPSSAAHSSESLKPLLDRLLAASGTLSTLQLPATRASSDGKADTEPRENVSTASSAVPSPNVQTNEAQLKPKGPSQPIVGTPTAGRSRMSLQPKRINPWSQLCSVCFKSKVSNLKGEPEDMIVCAECCSSAHPSCLGIGKTATAVVHTYPWQCLECKTCQVCSNPDQEDKMVCCDECDRGYHSFCVGLKDIPSGQWLCPNCGSCASCGATSPGSEPGSKWKHEYIGSKFLRTLCMDCSRYFRKGYFCPVCLKVYHDDETDSPMVCCDNCDRWIHTDCDGISEDRYTELSKDKSSYKCCICRGEIPEKLNTFHKKYRTAH